MFATEYKMTELCVLFGILLAVDLAVAQNNLPGKPVLVNFTQPRPTVGEDKILICQSTSLTQTDEAPEIKWLYGANFLLGATLSRSGLVSTSVVSLPITSRQMIGTNITCQASNSVGQRDTVQAIGDILQPPTVSAIIPGALSYDEGETGTWTLYVNNTYPGLSRTPKWFVNGTESSTFTQETDTNIQLGTYSYKLVFTRSLVSSDHALIISCQIHHLTLPEDGITKYTTMIVRHPPGIPNINYNFANGVNEFTTIRGNCSSKGGYPLPNISWSGGGVVSTSYRQGDLAISEFQATATVNLIGETFTCTAANAMSTLPVSVSLQQVFVGPGPVVIEGFNRTLIEGSVLNMTCTSKGAKPRAVVQWTFPNGSVDRSFSTEENRTSTTTVNNVLYTARFVDNGKTFMCNASNQLNSESFTSQSIIVHVQPQTTDLYGPSEAHQGIAVNYTCETPRSEPPTNLLWLVDNIVVKAYFSPTQSQLADGTQRTTTTITVEPIAGLSTIIIQCEAEHSTLTSNLKSAPISVTVRMKPTIQLNSSATANVSLTTVHFIRCIVTSDIEFNVTWWHVSSFGITQQVIGDNSKYIIWRTPPTVATLTIQDYQSTDDGRYYAVASNYAGQSSPSASARTTGYAIPTKPLIPTFEYYPVAGRTVLMNCTSTNGVPNTVITWYRNTTNVDSSSATANNITYNDYTHQVVFADKWVNFTCVASNIFGNRSTSVKFLDVYVTPTAPTISGVNIVLQNHTFSFVCSTFASNPAATISWTYGGENVTSRAISTQEPSSQKTGTLNVYSNLTLPIAGIDVGKILTCFVHHVTLPVTPLSTDHALIVYLIPTAYVAEVDSEAELGTTRMLTCNVETVLSVTVLWYKTGSNAPLQNNQLNYIIGQRTLTFSPVILEHEGSYMCSAYNAAGSSGLSTPVVFTVYQLPGVPTITFPVTGVEGKTIYTNASIYGGYPVPTLTWARNGTALDSSSTTIGNVTYNTFSFIPSLADIKVPFRVTSANAFGTRFLVASLTDVYAPATSPAIDGASEAYEDGPIQHQCYSVRARPAPAFFWFLGDTDMTSQASQSSVNNSDFLTVRTISNLTFTPTPEDVGKPLICVLHQPDGHDFNLSITLTLTIYLKPRVSLEPTSSNVKIGTNKNIRCRVDSVLGFIVLWFIDNFEISPTDNNYFMSGEYLTIVDFQTADDGAYSCKAENKAGLSNQTSQMVLSAYDPPGVPTITISPSSVPYEGETISLTCTTSNGVPSPNITWSKGVTPIYDGITIRVMEGFVSSTLTFVVNYIEDTGAVYNCTTMNDFGTLFTTALISTVHVLPSSQRTTILGNSILYENQTSLFYCETMRTLPPASISWFLDEEFLAGQISQDRNSDGTYNVFSNLTHRARYSDSGVMKLVCRVSFNETGPTINKTLQLYGYSIPRVSITNSSVTVEKGRPLTLHCTVVSELGATVSWHRSNTGLAVSSTTRFTFNGPNLTINAVDISDEGPYHCAAQNAAGVSDSSNILVATVFAYPVKPVIAGLEVAVVENTILTINCTSADGYPLPIITWYRNGALFLTAPAGLVSSYTFVVTFSGREDVFTCNAANFYSNSTSDPKKIQDVYVLPSETSLSGPTEVYETQMSVFLCNTRAYPNPTFRWLVGTSVVTSTANVTTHGSDYQISSYFSHVFEASDMNKNVTCIVTQLETNTTVIRSRSVLLHLLPEIQNVPESRLVELFTAASVVCVVSSTETNFSIQWYKDGVLIDVAASRGKLSTVNNVLTISPFEITDSGLYTCRARHQGGQSEIGQPSNLTAFGIPTKPIITTSHPNGILLEGASLILNCSTSIGFPVPSLVWKRGTADVVVDGSSKASIDVSASFVYNDYSSVVAFSDNSSVYVCETENEHATVSTEFALKDVYVTPQPKVEMSPVLWDEENKVASFNEDQTYSINGTITRYNPKTAAVRWLVGNVDMAPSYIGEIINSEGTYAYMSSLDLLMSSNLNGTHVTFMVTHPETTSSNASFAIIIRYKPRVSIDSPSGLVRKGATFTVTCNVISGLDYNVTWTNKASGTRIVTSTKYFITGTNGQILTVLNADYTDSVTYVCSSMNSVGMAKNTAEFYLRVYEEAGLPIMSGFNRIVYHGDTVSVYCNSSGGNPQAAIEWERNGVPLQTGFLSIYGNDNTNPISSVLTFVVNFTTDRGAVFKCSASNAYSTTSSERRFADVYKFSHDISLTDISTVTEFMTYTVYCETKGMFVQPEVIWMINGFRRSNGVTISFDKTDETFSTNSSLTFMPTRSDNGHDLVCIMQHSSEGRKTNASRTLNVQFRTDDPVITGYQMNITENTLQSYLCTVRNGNPRPVVRWLKNSIPIPSIISNETTDGQGNNVTTNRYSFIASIQGDSFAEYTCQSEHVVRNSSATVQLGQINAPPSGIELVLPSEPLTASEPQFLYPNLISGKPYRWLGAVARSQPQCVVDWIIGNRNPSNYTLVVTNNTDGTVRTVTTLYYTPTLADNGQQLTFNVFHSQTSTVENKNTQLVVHGPPSVMISLDSVDVIVNNDFTGQCNTTSSLTYSVKWYKGATELSNGAKYMLSGDVLTIFSVQSSDEGPYSCTATNAAGQSTMSNAALLSVISGGGFPAITNFVLKPTEGSTLPLTCTSEGGKPTPDVIWKKNNETKDATDFLSISNGVTVKTNIWFYTVAFADRDANFTCLVTNSVANKTRHKTFEDVYIPPVNIANSLAGPTTSEEGNVVTFSINFTRVNPAPAVSWSVGGNTLPSNVPSVTSVETAAGYLNAIASITFVQRAEYNKKVLVAAVRHPETSTAFDVAATLTVNSAPSVPTIDGFPNTNISTVGRNHQLVCKTIGGYPVPTLMWYRNGVPIPSIPDQDRSTEPIVTTATYNLSVQLTEKGAEFRCTAQNDINGMSIAVSLKDVYVEAELESLTGNSDVISGKNTSFTCKTRPSHPEPRLHWSMLSMSGASENLPVSTYTVIQQPANGLVSVESTVYFVPDQDDTGKAIECASTQLGLQHVADGSLPITVHGPPSATALSNTTSILGETKTFTCSVVSSLTPYNVTWYKSISNTQATLLQGVNEQFSVSNIHPMHKLIIYNIDVDDNGVYFCIVQSAAGVSQRAEVWLTVYTKPTSTSFENGLSAVAVTETSGDINARCLTDVHPANNASFMWYFSRTDSPSVMTEVDSSYVSNDELNIPRATRQNSGLYTCKAVNHLGNSSASFSVDVQYPPELDTNNVQTEYTKNVDELVQLVCKVLANPAPVYTWMHENETVGTLETLEVSVESGTNIYTCVATNALGSSGFIYTIEALGDSAPATGASTAEEGLSSAVIAAIVLGVIFFLLILIICCVGCKAYKDKQKKEKARSPEKKKKPKHKPSSVVPDTEDKHSTLYPRSKDPALIFGPARHQYDEQRHYPREIHAGSFIERDYSHRDGFDPNAYYFAAPGSEVDNMFYRDTGFRQRRPKVLPPVTTALYTKEAKRRKDRRRKAKRKRQQERQAAEGMENPEKSKDTSQPIVIDDNRPEKDAAADTKILLGDKFKN